MCLPWRWLKDPCQGPEGTRPEGTGPWCAQEEGHGDGAVTALSSSPASWRAQMRTQEPAS